MCPTPPRSRPATTRRSAFASWRSVSNPSRSRSELTCSLLLVCNFLSRFVIVPRYVYKKMCKKVPREICSSADYKTLVPSCTPTTYKVNSAWPKILSMKSKFHKVGPNARKRQIASAGHWSGGEQNFTDAQNRTYKTIKFPAELVEIDSWTHFPWLFVKSFLC